MYLDVLENRWLMLTLLGGAALVLAVALGWLAFRRPRQEGLPPVGCRGEATLGWLAGFVPWVLAVVAGGLAVWGIVYTYVMIVTRYTPNW